LDNVVIIKFKGSRREFYQNYLDLPFGIGDYAVVETANGENMGLITQTKLTVDSESIKKERKILRKANSNDILIFSEVVYVRYPTQEWAALKLADFDAKFSDMSVS